MQRALAMGADRGVRIDLATQDPLSAARALATRGGRRESPDLVLCGVQSADLANGAVGAALAGLLGLPFVGVAVAVEREGDGLLVSRELEGGLLERVAVQLPAVVSVQTGINSPRYVNFRQLKQAEATPIDLRDGRRRTGRDRLADGRAAAGRGRRDAARPRGRRGRPHRRAGRRSGAS